MVDGLAVNASYKPQGTAADSALGYGVSYTGVEGLAVHYATTDIEGATVATSGDQTYESIICLWSSNCWLL